MEKQVREILNRIVSRLHENTQTKLHFLLSDEAELKRQVHYFQWLQAFLTYQREVINPVEFLTSFKYHSDLIKSVPSELLETSPIVLEDLKLDGNLNIIPAANRLLGVCILVGCCCFSPSSVLDDTTSLILLTVVPSVRCPPALTHSTQHTYHHRCHIILEEALSVANRV